MTKRQRRMAAVASLIVGLGLATALGVTAFRKNLMYFYTPSDLVQGQVQPGVKLRLGGMVQPGSLQRGEGLRVSFLLADCDHKVAVRHEGILPDLFREGQGVVATGALDARGDFVADEVLAKHDENYMPPQVAEAMKDKAGTSCQPFKSVYGKEQAASGKRQDVAPPKLSARLFGIPLPAFRVPGHS